MSMSTLSPTTGDALFVGLLIGLALGAVIVGLCWRSANEQMERALRLAKRLR